MFYILTDKNDQLMSGCFKGVQMLENTAYDEIYSSREFHMICTDLQVITDIAKKQKEDVNIWQVAVADLPWHTMKFGVYCVNTIISLKRVLKIDNTSKQNYCPQCGTELA